MKREPSYTPEAKARALAALLSGERPRVVAREFGIPESTVTTWRHRLKAGKLRHEKKGGAFAGPGGG
ncbi:MAG: helix-turn-helix domain-containing protein [Rubrobacter sp.]